MARPQMNIHKFRRAPRHGLEGVAPVREINLLGVRVLGNVLRVKQPVIQPLEGLAVDRRGNRRQLVEVADDDDLNTPKSRDVLHRHAQVLLELAPSIIVRQLAQHPLQIVEPLAAQHTDLVDDQDLDELRPELLAEALVHAAEVLLALGHADARRAVDRGPVHVRRGDARRRADGDLLRVLVAVVLLEEVEDRARHVRLAVAARAGHERVLALDDDAKVTDLYASQFGLNFAPSS